ncbi:response regulator [Corallococcus sp. M34]|uniref:two-component regulator propeller domain-containing protein n=1 Tax=Citreicoccus inhibens TaxID=2849499 RepID=UPI001C2414C4|nr:two-component regulator propeller domain-containing protein [Citreicoccus inhibens]MBU8896686.1 response regulator [Citreicoccus inhibens]
MHSRVGRQAGWRHLIHCCFLVVLLLGAPGLTLDAHRRVTQYVHDVWQSEDGLPQNTIFSMAQTRDGYVWLGTFEGLVRFDGARFTVFDRRNTPELRSHAVSALLEDASGTLWVGTERGLLAYGHGGFVRAHGAASPLADVKVTVLALSDGVLWVGTREGLWQVPLTEGATAQRYTEAQGLPSNIIHALASDAAGGLWVGTDAGLARLVGGRVEPAPFPFPGQEAAPPSISALREDAAGVLWMGTAVGLFSWAEGRVTRYTEAEGLPAGPIGALLTDRHGNLWVGTRRGGLVRYGAGTFERQGTGEALASVSVLSLLEDSEGSLWVGTFAGLHRLRDGAFATFGRPEGLGHETASAVLESRDGVLWLGTMGGGLFRLEEGHILPVTVADGMPEETVLALAETPDGALWVGTMGGVYRSDGRHHFTRVLSRAQGLPDDTVTALLPVSGGDLWVGMQHGLARVHGGAVTVYGAKQGVPTDAVAVMLEDPLGGVWFGSDAGLMRWDGKGFTRYTMKDGLPGDAVLALLADPDGTLWVGTETGLARRKDGRWTRYTTDQGLYDDAVFSLVPDGEGFLWMSSNKGVSRVSRRDLEEVAEGLHRRVEAVGFDARDGMRSGECNGNTQPSGFRGRDGRLWFTTIRGMVAVDPARVRPGLRPPDVRMEEIRVQGQPVPLESRLELPPGTTRLELRFTAFAPGDTSRLPFRYRLAGHDEGWVDADGRRTATYTNLRPGRYRFEVTARGRDGAWSEPASLEVVLVPRPWQRTGFWALFVLGVGLLGTAVYLLRVGRLKARERWLEARVQERTAELELANRELEDNMRALRDTQAQLLQAGKMAAVGTLAAGVGHEINNPLAYIVSNLEHACTEAESLATLPADAGPRLRDLSQALREALHGADRVRRIVRDLKTFSRRDDEALGPVDLTSVLESAAKMASSELRHRARVIREYGEVPKVEGNEARLVQVFLNLLINAAQALPEGRAEVNSVRLVIRTGAVGEVVAEVRDTGSGMAPEMVGRIFDPFFTTKPVGVGTGLGLSLCHAYVTGMGGQISVESELGKGSVFRVTLRAARAPGEGPVAAREDAASRVAEVAAPVRGKVLVVDDEPMVSGAIRRTLAREHDVEVMVSSRQALERLRAPDASFDVILCDLMMPELTGMELHDALEESTPQLAARMVFITGGAFTSAARTFLERVRNPRVEKPFEPEELREVVRSGVARARGTSSRAA